MKAMFVRQQKNKTEKKITTFSGRCKPIETWFKIRLLWLIGKLGII